MQIAILGPLEVRTDTGAPVEVAGARLRTLLIRLALDPGRVVTTSRLVDAIWVDDPPAGAANALQALVSRLRRAVTGLAIGSQPAGYRLDVPPDVVDAVRFERLAAAGRDQLASDLAGGVATLRAALRLWRGAALADVADRPFAHAAIARLDELRLTAVEHRVGADLRLGVDGALVAELEELVISHPGREPLVAALMRALCALGRPADALGAYDRARAALRDRLGTDPSPALARLHLAVLRGDIGPQETGRGAGPPGPGRPNGHRAPADATTPTTAPAATPDTAPAAAAGTVAAAPVITPIGQPTPGNLPVSLTSFVGRDEDVARVGGLTVGSRLVTLIGPGGAGKTRLAIESANRLRPGMPDGAWLVGLAPVTDPAEVPATVLAALDLREHALIGDRRLRSGVGRVPAVASGAATAGSSATAGGADGAAGRSEADDGAAADGHAGGTGGANGPAGTDSAEGTPTERLLDALAGKQLLLVLDNCEHVIDAAARLADQLLARCPLVRVLATSREPLAITGESLWPVEPLALPDAEAGPAEAVSYPAVRLFADRAGAVRPGFTVDDANVADVIRVCRTLDGMPLAIELAAARLRALNPAQLAGRLDDRFRLLRAGSRIALPRHQTLRAVVDWSWDLLDGPERMLWRRLAFFSGGATLEAAEAVCAGGGVAEADVLDLLAALVDKSLLVVGGDGTPRYRMLETIRAYGLDRLDEAGEREEIRRAHAAFFVELAESAEPRLRRADQLWWLDRLAEDHDNLHGAIRSAVAAGDASTAVRLVGALGWYWWLRGHKLEGAQLTRAALAVPGEAPDTARALAYGVGALNLVDAMHDARQALEWLAEAARLGVESAHPLARLACLIHSVFAATTGDTVGIASFDNEALERHSAVFHDPDPWVRATAHVMRAHTLLNFGHRHAEAQADLLTGLAGYRRLGERWGIAFSLSSIAELVLWRGDFAQAEAYLTEGVDLLTELGSGEDVAQFRAKLAMTQWLLGRPDQARDCLDRARREARRVGSVEVIGSVSWVAADLARLDGDRTRARVELAGAAEFAMAPGIAPQYQSIVSTMRGLLDGAEGDLAGAGHHHLAAVRAAASSSDSPVIARALVGAADLALLRADPAAAAQLLAAAETIRGVPDLSLVDAGRIAEAARAALGPAEYATARDRGGSVTAATAYELTEWLLGGPEPTGRNT